MNALQETLEVAQGGIKQVQEGFTNPDDDWVPIMLLNNGEITGTQLNDFFANESLKDLFADVIAPALIEKYEPEAVVLITSAWMAHVDKSEYETDEFVRPSEHPDRKECVIVQGFARDEYEVWCAEIERHEDSPPTLGAWQDWSHAGYGEGRMVDGIKGALNG